LSGIAGRAFVVRDFALGGTRTGGKYLPPVLADRKGMPDARVWDAAGYGAGCCRVPGAGGTPARVGTGGCVQGPGFGTMGVTLLAGECLGKGST